MADESDSVWINTHLIGDRYRVTIAFDKDHWVYLDREEGLSYASAVLSAATAAEYDAAIFAQMRTRLGVRDEAIAEVVRLFRERRPPVRRPLASTSWGHGKKARNNPTDVMELVPGVSAYNGKAFLLVKIKDKEVGQWTVEDAREHASWVLESVTVAEYDTAYFGLLLAELLGTGEEGRASQIVAEIEDFREGVR